MKKRELHPDLPPRSDPNYLKLYRLKNKERLDQQTKDWVSKKREEDPDYWRKKYDGEKARNYRVNNRARLMENNWKKHGIVDMTYEKYLAEKELQNNRCKICDIEMTIPHVDHDHATGKYRAILCNSCNGNLGIYELYKDRFEGYLKNFSRIAK